MSAWKNIYNLHVTRERPFKEQKERFYMRDKSILFSILLLLIVLMYGYVFFPFWSWKVTERDLNCYETLTIISEKFNNLYYFILLFDPSLEQRPPHDFIKILKTWCAIKFLEF